MNYHRILDQLRTAYDARVDEREQMGVFDWKHAERARFLERVLAEKRTSLLELGAGPGTHGRWFADAGLEVVCVDASPAMVEACRAKGLEAHVQDFLSLHLERAFDAGFAMNCLLHVPPANLPAALAAIHGVLAPGALLYIGHYGGVDWQGINPQDSYEPKRYFSVLSDERLQAALAEAFEMIEFTRFELPAARPDSWQFQSATLRVRG